MNNVAMLFGTMLAACLVAVTDGQTMMVNCYQCYTGDVTGSCDNPTSSTPMCMGGACVKVYVASSGSAVNVRGCDNSTSPVSGCYTGSTMGYTGIVCECNNKNLCNTGSNLLFSPVSAVLAIVAALVVTHMNSKSTE